MGLLSKIEKVWRKLEKNIEVVMKEYERSLWGHPKLKEYMKERVHICYFTITLFMSNFFIYISYIYHMD